MRVLALALLAASASAQPLTVFPEPAGDRAESCTALDEVRVCRVESVGEASLVVSREGDEVARWAAPSHAQAGEFAAFAGDLDRDGGRDLIVASLTAVSNGLGVAYWRVEVVPDGASAPAYAFQAEDFGPRGTSFGQHRGRLILWATDWTESDDPSGRRASGMYLVGRPFALTSAGLAPAPGLPIRARRLLHSFDRSDPAGPVGWLSDRRAESRREDPAFGGCRQRGEIVTVRSVREATDEDGGRFLSIDVGRELAYLRTGYVPDAEDITHLGDAESGRIYPAAYAPPALADALTGRDLTLTTCAEDDGVRARVLWW
ncbi:MAG TPA: hypothetical protein EYQ24_02660 [Bacteroidetes bacterium]|nr:hypothetical protein [Bacteroidota bacterium]HIL56545.1 hypothetical protein [Rhodothermales bacterium]